MTPAGATPLALALAAVIAMAAPQRVEPPPAVPLNALSWRNIGPLIGGRSIAVAGSTARPLEYYFGATGGGLWKTTDGGTTWHPVTDGQIHSSSVGAVAVSSSNPDVVYIGMGESELRGNVMQGDGVYRSADAGRTWRHSGLADTLTISRIRVHPSNPDLVYVAALGDPTQPSRARGVYRSRDGGTTWKQILFRDEQSGAVDLAMDPQNPSTIYATLWQVRRQPWQLWSGGPGSGLFKSTDGGDTWTDLTSSPGMPGRADRQDRDRHSRRRSPSSFCRHRGEGGRAVSLGRRRRALDARQRQPRSLAALLLLQSHRRRSTRSRPRLRPQLHAGAIRRRRRDLSVDRGIARRLPRHLDRSVEPVADDRRQRWRRVDQCQRR